MKIIYTLLFISLLPLVTFSQHFADSSWRYYRPGNTGIQGDYVTALYVDQNGDPYIAANTGDWGEGGFARFDQTENKWINYSNVDYPVLGSFDNADVHLLEIIRDNDNNLWMGNYAGALKFDPLNGVSSIERFDANNSALLGFTYDIDLAPDSTIWFTSGGLVRYNPADNQWTYWDGSNVRIAVQPKSDGSYIVWSADTYYGQIFNYNSSTNELTSYLPAAQGDVAGLPGKDCVDDAGNFWAVRMATDGNWETLEYQRSDGVWVYPTPPYENVSYYIDAFKAYGNGNALMVLSSGEVWMFDGITWNNYGVWRPDQFTQSIDADQQGNVWVCGTGGAAKRDVQTGNWQRYRITNTSQIDYFVEDLALDTEGNVWMAGNAGSGVGGFQKFDGTNWTGFNQYTYGLGYDFPFEADNVQAICRRPSDGDVIINPLFHGIHGWNGANFFPIEDFFTQYAGLIEDTQDRLWAMGKYGGIKYFNDVNLQWTEIELTGWASKMINDPVFPGTVWAATDYEIKRTDGINTFSRTINDFPGSAAWLTGLAVEEGGIAWIGTWSQFTSTGSTLIRLDANTGNYDTWSYDNGWPFPGEHVRPMAITPDGLLWMQYDSEYPSTDAGLCWFDGVNVGSFPSAPGGIPQWGGLPNSTIKDLEVREITGGYELWMSCLGRGIAVLKIITDPVNASQNEYSNFDNTISIYPNPSNDYTNIDFTVSEDVKTLISVYDVFGKKIKNLTNSKLEVGDHTIRWDLTDESGTRIAKGIYFIKMTNGKSSTSGKIIIR